MVWHLTGRWAIAALATMIAVSASRADDAQLIKLKLTSLIQRLETGGNPERIEAAGELAKMGSDGKPAAKPLCKMAVDSTPPVSQAGLDALESVWPEMHRAAITLLRDKEEKLGKSPMREGACNAIAKLGDGAEAGVPFLVQSLRSHIDKDDDFFGVNPALTANVEALKLLAPTDPAFHKILIAASGPTNIKHANRALAVRTMGILGEDHPKLRTTFLMPVRNALSAYPASNSLRTHPKNNLDQVRQAAVEALGKFGKEARIELTVLKKIRAGDPVDAIRSSAADAIAKIDAAK